MFPLLIKIFPLFAENISEPAGKIIFRVFLQVPSSLFASLGKPCLIIESVWQTHHNDDDGDDDDDWKFEKADYQWQQYWLKHMQDFKKFQLCMGTVG